MQDNLHKLVNQKSLKSKEKIGSKLIKSLFDQKGVICKGEIVLLSTGGNKLPVTLSYKVNKIRFTHNNLKKLQAIHGREGTTAPLTTKLQLNNAIITLTVPI